MFVDSPDPSSALATSPPSCAWTACDCGAISTHTTKTRKLSKVKNFPTGRGVPGLHLTLHGPRCQAQFARRKGRLRKTMRIPLKWAKDFCERRQQLADEQEGPARRHSCLKATASGASAACAAPCWPAMNKRGEPGTRNRSPGWTLLSAGAAPGGKIGPTTLSKKPGWWRCDAFALLIPRLAVSPIGFAGS